jgi:hypothetical protein
MEQITGTGNGLTIMGNEDVTREVVAQLREVFDDLGTDMVNALGDAVHSLECELARIDASNAEELEKRIALVTPKLLGDSKLLVVQAPKEFYLYLSEALPYGVYVENTNDIPDNNIIVPTGAFDDMWEDMRNDEDDTYDNAPDGFDEWVANLNLRGYSMVSVVV